MGKVIYMKVTDDEYELPLAVAGSAAELARMVGVKENSIFIAIQRERKKGWKSRYVKVVVEED